MADSYTRTVSVGKHVGGISVNVVKTRQSSDSDYSIVVELAQGVGPITMTIEQFRKVSRAVLDMVALLQVADDAE